MKLTRALFALLVMGLVAAALTLATVNWMEHRPGEVHSASEKTEMLEVAETPSADRDVGLSRP